MAQPVNVQKIENLNFLFFHLNELKKTKNEFDKKKKILLGERVILFRGSEIFFLSSISIILRRFNNLIKLNKLKKSS